jgi:hypothetical protein
MQAMKGKCQISLTDTELSQLADDDDNDQTMVDDDELDAVVAALADSPAQAAPASPEKPKAKPRRKVVRRKAA